VLRERSQPPSSLTQRLQEGAMTYFVATGDRRAERPAKYHLSLGNPPTQNVMAITVTPRAFYRMPERIPVGHFDAASGRFTSYGIINTGDPEVTTEALRKMRSQSNYDFETPETRAVHLQQQELLDTNGLKQTVIDRYNEQRRKIKGLTVPELHYDDNTSFTFCLTPEFDHINLGRRGGQVSVYRGDSLALKVQGGYTENQYVRAEEPVTIRLAYRGKEETEFQPNETILRSYEFPLVQPIIRTLEEAPKQIPGFNSAAVAVVKAAA